MFASSVTIPPFAGDVNRESGLLAGTGEVGDLFYIRTEPVIAWLLLGRCGFLGNFLLFVLAEKRYRNGIFRFDYGTDCYCKLGIYMVI